MSTDFSHPPTSLPIAHWSFSSLSLFLRNRFMWKRRYVLKIYDNTTSPSALIGKAAHKALDTYFTGGSVDAAMNAGLALIDMEKDENVRWGQSTRESVRKDYAQAFNFYLDELDMERDIGTVVASEKSITAFVQMNGIDMSLPAKSVTDLIVRRGGELELIDHKFVSRFSSDEESKGAYMLQAQFNYHTVRAELGEAPKRMRFRECKISKNKDGSPQVREHVVEYDEHPEHFALFYALYDAATVEIAKSDLVCLPNISDIMDGDESFKHWSAQTLAAEKPVMVTKRTEHKEFVEKVHVPSEIHVVDNAHLTDEERIRVKLAEFGISVKMERTVHGSNVTLFLMKPSRGVRMSDFDRHAKDVALALKAESVRVEAPVRGTDLVGIEVPAKERVFHKFIPDADKLDKLGLAQGTLRIPLGVDVYGNTVVKDLAAMPHLLVAGATGSGKSVMMNVAIRALMAQNSPDTLNLILIDPKRVELAAYKESAFLLTQPIYDTEKAVATLEWLVGRMEERYDTLEASGMKNIEEFTDAGGLMPRIVTVIDEFADLVLQSEGTSAEKSVIRLAQKARAVGIHLIIGTQRPSVDVVSGILKANVPCRLAFSVASKVDSQVILDTIGAEELCGKGDALLLDPGSRGLTRIQSFYV